MERIKDRVTGYDHDRYGSVIDTVSHHLTLSGYGFPYIWHKFGHIESR